MSHICSSCGLCCRLFLINLTKKEWESGKYETQFQEFPHKDSYRIAQKYGATLLKQHSDGSCIYQKNDMCSIHTDRPKACRAFFCSSKAKRFQTMVSQIQEARKK